MLKLRLAALVAICAAPVHAQAVTPAPIDLGEVDTAEERRGLQELTACLIKLRPRWARETLAQPYLSDAQASEAAVALVGKDNCVARSAEVTFRTSSIVGSMAEHFVRSDIGRVDFRQLTKALTTIEALNVSEDFALCLASADPAAARDLALSEFGSEAERIAAGHLAANVSRCTNKGENLTVDLQSLRALTSTALYRGISALAKRGG